MVKEWLKKITVEDMPNRDMQLVAEQCGVEVAAALLDRLNGICIYIPKLGDRNLIKRYILNHYDGSNAKNLALELSVSEQFVYKTLAEDKPSQVKNTNQLNLLEGDNNGKVRKKG